MRAWQIVAVVSLGLVAGGCAKSDPASDPVSDPVSAQLAEKLIAGDFEGVAAAATGADPTHQFALSVARYFLDDYEGMNQAREHLLADPSAREQVTRWIGDHVGAGVQGAMADFLRGIAAQMTGDENAARGFYESAATTDRGEPRFARCEATVDPEATYVADIPESRALTYQGKFVLDRSVWVPKRGEAEILGGGVITSLGAHTYEATFGDWDRVGSDTPGTQVGWCPLLTEGTLLLPPPVVFDDLGDDILFTAEGSYAEHPFDYFGRYRLVTLGEGRRYPMIWVPYLLRDPQSPEAQMSQWASRAYLGETVRVSPRDVDTFLQPEFFPIKTPWNIALKVNHPDNGLEFNNKLNEVPGEFRFLERSKMYVETDDPDDSIAVQGINGRLHWLENTTIGRKKVYDTSVWGPLRTNCVLPGETLDPPPPTS